MLGIGINEYVHIGNETKINDAGNLEIQLKAKLSDDEVLQMVVQGKEVSDGSIRLQLFPSFKVDFETKVRKSLGQITKDIQEYQKDLREFLKVYLTEAQIEEHFNFKIMLGAAASEQAFIEGLKKDDFVDKVYTHVATKFIEVLKKFSLLEHKETFRIKLWRQSEAKAFPRIPGGFGKWIESMRVPFEASELKPSEYEIKNNKLSREAAKVDNVNKKEEEKAAADLFTPKAEEDELPFK